MRVALIQITSGEDPLANLEAVGEYLREAAEQGATFALTPEVTNCLSNSRDHQRAVMSVEDEDPVLAGLRKEAKALGIWLLIGSLGVKTRGGDGRFANRSFLIAPDGEIRARYDKIHMFDVDVTPEETYRESDAYRPGEAAVVTEVDGTALGLTICYDVRFPALHRALAEAGARILTAPAAFSHVTGPAHWEPLLRARAIETGCFVLAPAQTGTHVMADGPVRRTHGHSLIVAPWGEVLLDAGTEPGVYLADLDLDEIDNARRRVPALANARSFAGPE